MERKSTQEIIKDHLLKLAESDQQLNESLSKIDSNQKSFDEMFKYIIQKANIELEGKNGAISDQVVFGWAIHYFTESKETLELETPKRDMTPWKIEKNENREPVVKESLLKKTKRIKASDQNQLKPYVQLSLFGDDNVF